MIWSKRNLQSRWLIQFSLFCNLYQCIEGAEKESLRRRVLWRWEDRTSLRGELRDSFRKTETGKVCPGERKTSPPKCLLFHAFFRIAYIATSRWMNNKCMFALPSFLTTYFATNRWVGRAYKEESPVEERRQNCSKNRGKNIMMMPPQHFNNCMAWSVWKISSTQTFVLCVLCSFISNKMRHHWKEFIFT